MMADDANETSPVYCRLLLSAIIVGLVFGRHDFSLEKVSFFDSTCPRSSPRERKSDPRAKKETNRF